MAEGADQEEKSQEPSQKRLEDARKRGDVAKSLEVNTWFTMLGATFLVMMFAEPMTVSLGNALKAYLAGSHSIAVDGPGLLDMLMDIGIELGSAAGPALGLMALAAVAGTLLQVGLLFSGESLAPKFSRVSPLAGAKRLFSTESLVNLLKGLIKLAAVSITLVAVLWPERDRLETVLTLDLSVLLGPVREETLTLLGVVLAMLTVVAGLDFVYQRSRWFARQRMTLQEVKEEYKQQEGDPEIKGRIRRLRLERSRKRMMAEVPNASVVVTNPTHYAVALRYERGMNAPLCLAKGTDSLALKIREVAEAHGVPIVENPPLARALHATAELDREIAPEHYKAVAEVIGFVMRLRQRKGWRAS